MRPLPHGRGSETRRCFTTGYRAARVSKRSFGEFCNCLTWFSGVLAVSVSLKELLRPYYLKWFYFRLARRNCPSHFRECWEHPTRVLGPDAASLLPNAGGKPDFVFLPMVDWHTRMQRTQHLALALAELGHRVVYLNPHLGREFPRPYPFSPRRMVTPLAPGVLELHLHLPCEPVFHHRRLRGNESKRIVEAILQLLSTIGSRSAVVVVSFPLWIDVAVALRKSLGSPVVYDCHDLLEGFDNIAPELKRLEPALFEAADLVAFSAEPLAREHIGRMAGLESKHVLLRNAVRLSASAAGAPAPSRHAATKTIGYIGSLSSWFDVPAVRLAAGRHPDWRFVLVGRRESRELDALAAFPNVEFAGECAYGEVDAWLASFDVATIPFRVQPLTTATNPIKLYEYFARGLPVVSAPLPEVAQYSGIVYLASTPEEFVRQLEAAASERDPELRLRRQRIAERETWQSRCIALLDAISRRGGR